MTKLATTAAAEPATTTATVAGPVLDIRNLRTLFPTIDGDVVAIDDVSFVINPGETVAVVGESGSGKSVTAKSILRLTDYQGGEVRSGSMLYAPGTSAPMDLAKMELGDLRRVRGNEISMIFQEPLTSLNPVLKIGDQIAEAIILHQGKSRKEALAQALDALQLVRIPDAGRRLMQYPHELSGGMRQRAAIARCLATAPGLLLLDEPFGAVDELTRLRLNEDLPKLWEARGTTTLLVTHAVAEAVLLADRVVVFSSRPGRVVADIPIPLPRPRLRDLTREPAFRALADQVTAALWGGAAGDHPLAAE